MRDSYRILFGLSSISQTFRAGLFRSGRFKKGGVTTYIILGLVILLFASIVVYVFTQIEKEEQVQERAYLAKLPNEVQAPLLFVDSCIRQTARTGLELMGQHGGWISVDDPTLSPQTFTFGYFQTEYDGLALSLESDAAIKLPYWQHLASPSDCMQCSFGSNMPTIAQMETMLATYIDRELPSCINRFESLKDQYVIEELASVKSSVTMGRESVDVKVSYPIRIQLDESEFKHQDFPISMPVNLRRIYDLALTITNAERKDAFLERYTLNTLSAYQAVNKNSLPPIAAQEIGPGQVFWSFYGVKQNLQNVIRDNLLYLTIPGTHNFYPLTLDDDETNKDLKQGFYYGAVINILQDDTETEGLFDTIDANFFYLDWSYYFDISPKQGAVIRPSEMEGGFDFLPVFSQSYEFLYDFSFPVYVDLRDSEAFNGEGYSFLFGLEANIRNNQPFVPGTEIELVPDTASSFSLFSDPKQRISGIIRVSAIDEEEKPLSGVMLQYQCGDHRAYIGETDGDGRLESRFPLCQGGILALSKEDYYGNKQSLTTEQAVDGDISGQLFKIVTKKAEIQLRKPEQLRALTSYDYGSLSFADYRRLLNEGLASLANGSEAFITLARVNVNPLDDPFTRIVAFEEGDAFKDLDLIPGDYILNIQYLDGGNLSIPAAEKEFEVPDTSTLGLTKKKEKVLLPAIDNPGPVPLGGGILDAEIGGYWHVSLNDLKNNPRIRFFALVQEMPATHDQLATLGDVTAISEQYSSLLEPAWGS